MRTAKIEDASDRWGQWLADAQAVDVLNSTARTLSKNDVTNYIKGFDQKTRLLSGIFEKATEIQVGIIRLDIDYAHNQGLVSLFIGEPAYRNTGVTSQVFIPNLDYAFNTLRLDLLKANVLIRNKSLIRFLLKTGWKMDATPHAPVKSNADAGVLEVRTFKLAREDWTAWKQTDLARQVARLPAISPLLQAARSRRPRNDS